MADAVYIPRLKRTYDETIRKALIDQFNYKNAMEVPALDKIVLNMGVGEATGNRAFIDSAVQDMARISGQKPVITRARQSNASFKVRENMAIGVKVTLRREQMYEFLDRLVTIALPRVRDFRGVPTNSFDGRGNYSLGIREQMVFPEISYEQVDATRGFDVTIVTTAKTDEEARSLLELLGMPFRK